MKKVITYVLSSVVLLSCAKKDNKVYLKGELINFAQEYFMREDTPQGKLLQNGQTIVFDENNHFEISFELNKPSYYKLGRNTLYLSPGDHLDLTCDYKDPMKAEFKGDGETACNYLKAIPFPKAGSYLEAGKMIKDKPTLKEVRERVAIMVESKLSQLNKLENISPRFKKLEEGRIMFDAANSLHLYPIYLAILNKIPEEEIEAFSEQYIQFFANDIKNYLTDRGESLYLNLDVFREICDLSVEMLGSENVDREIIDFLKTEELLNSLSNRGPVAEVLTQRKIAVNELVEEDYKKIVEIAFDEYKFLLPGNKAPDLKLFLPDSTIANLSDYSNKVTIIDVWATWCVPCIKESPYFEELAKKYQNEKIEFISVSIDSDRQAWGKYLEKHDKFTQQFHTNRINFSSWLLKGIPRFIILDKNGIIFDAFAPAPSDPEFEQQIKRALNL
jgi:thiol-disulfide isomerase/thioredoxin